MMGDSSQTLVNSQGSYSEDESRANNKRRYGQWRVSKEDTGEDNENDEPDFKKKKLTSSTTDFEHGRNGASTINDEESDEATQSYDLDVINEENTVNSPPHVAEEEDDTNPRDHTVSGCSDNKVKPNIVKLRSVVNDTEQIANLINGVDKEKVYQKLAKVRNYPNRVEVVTNELLEEQFAEAETVEAQSTITISDDDIDTDALFADIPKVMKQLKSKNMATAIDLNKVFQLLEQNITKPDRVDIVVGILLNGKVEPAEGEQSKCEIFKGEPKLKKPDIMEDVALIAKRCPSKDPNLIFAMLEEQGDKENRVELVLDKIRECDQGKQSNTVTQDKGSNQIPKENVGLVRDTDHLSKMFPNKDKNEIYAYLEANYHNPHRVEIVMEELFQLQGSQNETPAPVDETPEETDSRGKEPLNKNANNENNLSPIVQLQADCEAMMAVFPDCDPNYIFERLEGTFKDPDRVDKLSAEMFETKQYPKLKDRQVKEKKEDLRRRLIHMKFNLTEFLQMFEDPLTHFYDTSKPMTDNYKAHCAAQLKNYFPMMQTKYIDEKLVTHKHHFTPALRELEKEAGDFFTEVKKSKKERKRKFRHHPRDEIAMPVEPDEYFYKEFLFTRFEDEIREHTQKQTEEKNRRLEEAKEKGELNECVCCYDDEVLFEDMLACPEGHLFCKECIKRSSETLIGEAKFKFPCLTGDCDSEFTTPCLQAVLSSKMFSVLLRKMQEEEIKQAGIDNLVCCPFCSFATIMDDPDDKVFKCLNPGCLKESCRLCKEPNHVPLRCEEVEKQGETDMRTFIETKLTEAMIRTCWKCKKRFFKVEGCNKMTCSCGAAMCYVCRKPIKDYSHFGNGPGLCPPDTDVLGLHKEEMEKAADEARKKYEEEHPEVAGQDLKYDPLKAMKEGAGKPGMATLFNNANRNNQQVGGFGMPFHGINYPHPGFGGHPGFIHQPYPDEDDDDSEPDEYEEDYHNFHERHGYGEYDGEDEDEYGEDY